MRTNEELSLLQSYPLYLKEGLTRNRIRELVNAVGTDGFYVSFSGGKDSEVAVDFTAKTLKMLGEKTLHVVHVMTGLEYLSTTNFCKPFCEYVSQKYGIEVVLDLEYPKKNFKEVLTDHGYPVLGKEISGAIYEARKGLKNGDGTYRYRLDQLEGKRKAPDGTKSAFNLDQWKFLLDAPFRISNKCCSVMKKSPAKAYEKRTGRIPLVATMAEESRLRKQSWLKNGCNAFDIKRPRSAPFSFWRQRDILEYIYVNKLPIAKAYGKVIPVRAGMPGQTDIFDLTDTPRTDCEFCTTGCDRTGCLYCLFGILSDRERIKRLEKIEPKRAEYVLSGGETDDEGYLVPNKEGLGYRKVLDWLKENGIDIPY